MLAAQRRRRLAELLRSRGPERVRELAEELGVSSSTVRRDLAELAARGLVVRMHGGAGSAQGEGPGGFEADPAAPAKRQIARAAAALVPDGATVMLLAGSTTAAMVPFLAERRDLTVVTNGLDLAHALAHLSEHVGVAVVGGLVHRDQMTMIGPMSDQNIRALHVDLMFGGAWGVDAEVGVTGPKVIQAARRREMLRHADALVVLADARKLGRRGPALMAEPDQIDRVLTDPAADERVVQRLRAAGLRVDLCP